MSTINTNNNINQYLKFFEKTYYAISRGQQSMELFKDQLKMLGSLNCFNIIFRVRF